MHFPPAPSRGREHREPWQRKVRSMMWLYSLVGSTSARWSPVLCGNLNGRLAETPQVTGIYYVHEFNYTSEMVAPGLRAHGMCAINTVCPTGVPAYYNRGVVKTRDYIMVPQEWHKATMWCRTLTRSEGRLHILSQSA
eukprot:5838126-Pyramimonas_sp.AAC.1